MWLLVYGMLVNVNDYYVHVCEQARWARSAGNSAIENICSIIIIMCLAFTRMPGESSRLKSLFLYLCDVFRAPVNSFVLIKYYYDYECGGNCVFTWWRVHQDYVML